MSPDPYKCYDLNDADFASGWRIDTKWMITQAISLHLYGHDEIIFSVSKDGKLFMRGIRMSDKNGMVQPDNAWIEEFPPWP
jgi:hypothetical protein